MAKADPHANAYAAVLAASSAVASRRAYRRGPMPGGLPAHLQLPSLPDVPSLLADPTDDAITGADFHKARIARVTTASLLYALRTEGYCERILSPQERRQVELLDHTRSEEKAKARAGAAQADQSCLYCRLFHQALYRGKLPAALVINHSAHVRTDFDPVTNIAEAGISGYQVIVPEDVALAMVAAFHPLRWSQSASETFRQTDEVFVPARGSFWDVPDPVTGDERSRLIDRWKTEPDHYLFEDVVMPWNGDINSEIKNVLRLRNFVDATEDGRRELGFQFALESCLETNFGLRVELGGLDIDGGGHRGVAQRWPERPDRLPDGLDGLTVRDLGHVRSLLGLLGPPQVGDLDESSGALATTEQKLETLGHAVSELYTDWKQQPWLVTISTSKRLRYTAPSDQSLGLWTALTWMAPAQLFVFINRVVTQAHVSGLEWDTTRTSPLSTLAPPAEEAEPVRLVANLRSMPKR